MTKSTIEIVYYKSNKYTAVPILRVRHNIEISVNCVRSKETDINFG